VSRSRDTTATPKFKIGDETTTTPLSCDVENTARKSILNTLQNTWSKMYLKYYLKYVIMAALRSRCGHYIFVLSFLSSSSIFLFSSPNLSGRRMDVYHTSTHDVALVQI